MMRTDLRVLVDNLDEFINIPGGIELLRKKVLHLAISGGLVSQAPTEGSGEELYKKIQENLIKNKRMPAIAEEPFDIPDSWKWVRLGEVIELKSGADLTPDKYNDTRDGIPYITGASNIQDGRINVNRWTLQPKNSATNGDLLITCKGTIGSMAFVDQPEVHIARQIMAIRTSKEINLFFIQIVIQTRVDALKDSAQSLIPGISRSDILEMPLPLPPLEEQNRIVEKFDEIGAWISELDVKHKAEQAERTRFAKSSLRALSHNGSNLALDNLANIIKTKTDIEELKKAILHLAVTGRLVPQIASEGTSKELYKQIEDARPTQKRIKKPEIPAQDVPFSVPDSWQWVRLGDLSDVFNGNSINQAEKALKYSRIEEGYPYIGTKDIGYGYEKIDYENGVRIPYEEQNFKIISTGTVLICSEGGSAGKKCGIIDRDVAFGNKMYAFKAYGDYVVPKFVLNIYLSEYFIHQFRSKMTGIIGGISLNNFKELIIPLPPFKEQNRIVERVDEFFNLFFDLEKKLDK